MRSNADDFPGIGRAIVERLINEGARVIAVDVVKAELEGVKEEDFRVCDQAKVGDVAELEAYLSSQ